MLIEHIVNFTVGGGNAWRFLSGVRRQGSTDFYLTCGFEIDGAVDNDGGTATRPLRTKRRVCQSLRPKGGNWGLDSQLSGRRVIAIEHVPKSTFVRGIDLQVELSDR